MTQIPRHCQKSIQQSPSIFQTNHFPGEKILESSFTLGFFESSKLNPLWKLWYQFNEKIMKLNLEKHTVAETRYQNYPKFGSSWSIIILPPKLYLTTSSKPPSQGLDSTWSFWLGPSCTWLTTMRVEGCFRPFLFHQGLGNVSGLALLNHRNICSMPLAP